LSGECNPPDEQPTWTLLHLNVLAQTPQLQ
jgi:hypothetical protein